MFARHRNVLSLWCSGFLVSVASAQPSATQPPTAQPPTAQPPTAPPSFVNWEDPHVHPLDITPDTTRLLAVNTADNRLEVFEVAGDTPMSIGSVPVGLDPVSVRAFSDQTAWVVNHISDSISVVDLDTLRVIATIHTDDEPADVIFAGSPRRAFVTCSQANTILVIDPANPGAPIVSLTDVAPGGVPVPIPDIGATIRIPLVGEDPRALAVNADGGEVYVALFESGNRTTILAGGDANLSNPLFGPSTVDDPASPYFNPMRPFLAGSNPPNPPPNNGALFNPPINPALPAPPRVGLIVRENAAGRWMDDNAHDWTDLVSGPNADKSQRPVGWQLLDHDVAVIDTKTLGIRYVGNLMNNCMALAVNPVDGRVMVVGTDATNEVRFEPVLNGRFLRVDLGSFNPVGPANLRVDDLNPHLTYTTEIPFQPIPQSERDLSLGDPRGIAWDSIGAFGYVTGMGSNNVIVLNDQGGRASAQPIPVGEGPTGIVLDQARRRAYVLNKFDASLSVIDLDARTELLPRVPFYDPTPTVIRIGRKHLYDTHRNSGLGHLSCASCHVDGRMDRLAWDLGNPLGQVKPFNQNCQASPNLTCDDWHPMKGPMTTQTLQDIIGKEPHHWRGDQDGLESFALAFQNLLGDDQPLGDVEMQEFEDFIATIHFPPDPFRNLDNTLPTDLPLTGHFSTGRFADSGGLLAGEPLPHGDAVRGLSLYRTTISCVTCHTLPTGMGPDGFFINGQLVPIPPGPKGEHHLALILGDGSTNRTMKISQLRNQYEKTGFDTTQLNNVGGFGYLHDGSVDSIARFVSLPAFAVQSDQDVADLVAFMLAFSGSDLPVGNPNTPNELPGPSSLDTHAAVGRQTTLISQATATAKQLALIDSMVLLADADAVGLVVKGRQAGLQRGYTYIGGNQFQSDRANEIIPKDVLVSAADVGSELTFTVVPKGTELRIGIDRDEDGHFDRDEIDGCSNPADPTSVPPQCGGPTHDIKRRSVLIGTNFLRGTDASSRTPALHP